MQAYAVDARKLRFINLTPQMGCGNIKGSLEAWCSGLTCVPVKDEIAGSNPVASAS